MNELLRRLLFLPPQRSTMAGEIDGLHYFVILVTMAGALAITLIGGYFLIRYRRRGADPTGHNPDGAVRPPMVLEIGAVVLLVFLFILWWAIGVRQFVALRVAPESSVEVYVTAKQWMWKFAYPRGQTSISALYVPANRPVRLIMTSRDVIHSFYVPDFRIKQDVVPGRYTTVWFEPTAPGTYEILCTEYCGAGHSVMRGQVIALAPMDYERWLEGGSVEPPIAGQEYSPPHVVEGDIPKQPLGLVTLGQEAAAVHGCLRCHTIDGTPFIGPTWAGLYDSKVPLEGGGEIVADEAYITESMMDPGFRIHRGFPPVMPSYVGRIRPPETAAIIELIKSLRDVRPQGAIEYRPAAQDAGVPNTPPGPALPPGVSP